MLAGVHQRRDSRACATSLKRIAGAEGLIAGRSLVASLSRTSVVVTALATAISMMVSVGIMVGSFRETVQVWLDSQLRADIYMRAAGPASAGIYPPIATTVPAIVRQTPGVAEVDIFHAFDFRYEGQRATFGGGDHGYRAPPSLAAISFRQRERNSCVPAGRDRAIVSEPFADKHHVRAGDVLRYPAGRARRPAHCRRNLLRVFERPRLCAGGPRHAAPVPAGSADHQHRGICEAGRGRGRRSATISKRGCALFR